MKKLLLLLIKAYALIISPLTPPCCRFYPTCSSYAAEAIETHGAWRGTYLALRRVLRCHPWHAGGFDPVPGTEQDNTAQLACGCHSKT